jgi:spectinomycin phosphotransferase/16S rRNA (guanine(1405)-N(7))-methyltransferase
MVLTHGEPHPGNTMTTGDGLVLVDWDTALVAPPERDLWTIAGDDTTVLAAYTAATGRTVVDDALECYRRSWDLTEIALYVALLRAAHDDTADVRESWHNLQMTLER